MKLSLCLAAALVIAFLPARHPQEKERKKHAEPETVLAGHMEHIEDAVKVVRRSMREKATPAALAALAEIEGLTLQCKALEPATAAKLPEKERAAFVLAYRRTMVDFLTRQLELEAALLDGDETAAQTAFERFREMEDSSHERFAPEED